MIRTDPNVSACKLTLQPRHCPLQEELWSGKKGQSQEYGLYGFILSLLFPPLSVTHYYYTHDGELWPLQQVTVRLDISSWAVRTTRSCAKLSYELGLTLESHDRWFSAPVLRCGRPTAAVMLSSGVSLEIGVGLQFFLGNITPKALAFYCLEKIGPLGRVT